MHEIDRSISVSRRSGRDIRLDHLLRDRIATEFRQQQRRVGDREGGRTEAGFGGLITSGVGHRDVLPIGRPMDADAKRCERVQSVRHRVTQFGLV